MEPLAFPGRLKRMGSLLGKRLSSAVCCDLCRKKEVLPNWRSVVFFDTMLKIW